VLVLAVQNTGDARDTWSGVKRIVGIGDLHGDYGQYVAVMTDAGLLANDEWAGGKAHLVQTGDITDRGPDSARIIRHLAGLARHAGGFILLLIGNHELMNMTHDLRYVHPGEYANLVTPASAKLHEALLAQVLVLPEYAALGKAALEARYPLGYVEHRRLWRKGEFGKAYARRNTVIRINELLFAHAGIDPSEPLVPLAQINRRVRKEVKSARGNLLPEDSFADDPTSPLWYRGYALDAAGPAPEKLQQLLNYYEAAHFVVGHSPTHGEIRTRLDGRVILIDVAISAHYGGHNAVLLVDGGQFFAIHRNVQIPLPMRDTDEPHYLARIRSIKASPVLP
jgi:hypothetical protein